MCVDVGEVEVMFQVGQVQYRLRLSNDLLNHDLHYWDTCEGGWMRVRHNWELGGDTPPHPTSAECAAVICIVSRTLKETLPQFTS